MGLVKANVHCTKNTLKTHKDGIAAPTCVILLGVGTVAELASQALISGHLTSQCQYGIEMLSTHLQSFTDLKILVVI